ncbi:TATA-binding protein-associated factor 172-like protein [Sarcoptes scabiei]|uniref:TATA-binding protein-associated factor 172-like protein n=1 Tax=Sarcoptes scabiei TaxID=52283 RepID=A0A132AJJ9_SARSC|nr:TATA-binding protein-associated factor 172-like protein [Sarcoptes scabiei]
MTSRLDRLFLLLDNGSTPLTRKAAALQLGEVQKLHPHELNKLLIKVRQYLHSSSWDTRIAASQAVEAITLNVPEWFPSGKPKEDCPIEENSLINEDRMSYSRYDVNTVIRCGHNLFASCGDDFDEAEPSVDSREKIAQMRQTLNQKLGLNFAEKIGLKIDFITNQDFESTDRTKQSSEIKQESIKFEEIIAKAAGGGIVKRKKSFSSNKFSNESRGNRENSIESSLNSNQIKKIKLEPKDEIFDEKTDFLNLRDDEWPLAWFSDELMSDLFNPKWEIRHGAAIGLREIVKLQGRCGGRLSSALSKDQDILNQQWLEDLSLRLLSVLALDKFGDYVSDQVIAPVRETCAQVLGLVIKFQSVQGVHGVLNILLQLLECSEWETRHGGMLGLKYLLAIRQDLIEELLPKVFEPIFSGLKDSEDDVSAVAAAALVPVKENLIKLIPEKVPLVVSFLWDALLVLDDLSSSTGDLLMLLSSLLTFKCPETKDSSEIVSENGNLIDLIPRLWPFLSHSLSSVRKSVLESLLILSEKSQNTWNSTELLSDALRLVYQRSLIENQTMILELLTKVWISLVTRASYECLIESTKNYVTGWIYLMMLPQKASIDSQNNPVWLEIKEKNKQSCDNLESSPASYFIGGSEVLGESSEERERCTIRARYQCAKLIGILAFHLTEDVHQNQSLNGQSESLVSNRDALDSFALLLLGHLNTKSAIQRMCCSWILREWAISKIESMNEPLLSWIEKNSPSDSAKNSNLFSNMKLHKDLSDRCYELLDDQILFDEISPYVSRVQFNFRTLLSLLRSKQIQFNETCLGNSTIFSFEQINTVVEDVNKNSLEDLRKKILNSKRSPVKLKNLLKSLEEKLILIQQSIAELNYATNSLSIEVKSSLASALISWRSIPDRMSPIIKPIMDSIKVEHNEQLQRASASSLVKLLNIFCERTHHNPQISTPTTKIINNLVTYLCSDRNFTPEATLEIEQKSILSSENKNSSSPLNAQLGILALDNMQKMIERNSIFKRSNSNTFKFKSNSEASRVPQTNGQTASSSSNLIDQEKQGEIQRRGSTIALLETCKYFGKYLPDQLPSLWSYIKKISLESQSLPLFVEDDLKNCQNLIHCLQVFEMIGPSLHQNLHSTLNCTYSFLCECLHNPYITLRHMAARCFGMLASIMPNQTMNVILTTVMDMLEASDSQLKRQGAVETFYYVIERLSLKIVPYIVLLIVPMLGRMSDQNELVRLLATHCFAQLVQLMPLDNDNQQKANKTIKISNGSSSSIDDFKAVLFENDIEFSEELKKRKEEERHFLQQLMNIKKLDDFKLLVPVKAELRQYQQDGLNWLGFLNKYKLHGIIADEMGLGKTLQAICILASDHYYIKQKFIKGESSNRSLLSLVICPPTLTGHWVHEVDKFVESKYLCPILYSGPPFERCKIKLKIQQAVKNIDRKDLSKNYNLVIASYDLVRNDIDFFTAIDWNYCILDEGHVIKNGKTKLSKSIKSLRANHRLILTGTPIQNNVLELWSLFDFLMPGFLGTERQFMARYSKPILASRDAKSSSKEQESGILAMETLHRQVLPFILRRMKEDVLKDLPPKIVQDYYCELSPLQAQLYEDFYKSKARQSLKDNLNHEVEELTTVKRNESIKSASKKMATKSHIFQSLQYLRKVCNHPKLVLSPSHPNYDSIVQKLQENQTSLSDISHAAKLGALKQLLQDCGIGVQSGQDQSEPVVNQHRALIFCQLKSMLEIVEKDLLKSHMPSVSYLRLDGDVPVSQRYSIIHRFNDDPSIDVLLLTIQVGGLGLNLTGADTVIFVEHDWNPMKDLQAMDRAHRIGQKKVVNVYRLITSGTLEEKIMGLQKFKLTIANTVISNENSSLDSMATDQLLDLFEYSSIKEPLTDSKISSTISSIDHQASTQSNTSQVSMKTMLESLPELWDTQQYENEYDLKNFLQTLTNL